MTEAHETHDMDGPHAGPIKTPKQLILAVLFAFGGPIFLIIPLVCFVSSTQRPPPRRHRMHARPCPPTGRPGRTA